MSIASQISMAMLALEGGSLNNLHTLRAAALLGVRPLLIQNENEKQCENR